MRIANNTLIDAPVDLSSAWESGAIWLGHIAICSIQLVFSGTTIDGSFKLQASNDLGDSSAVSEATVQANITNWTDIADTPTAVSASGDLMCNLEELGFRWIRVVWTPGTTVGNLTAARFNVKGV